MPCPSFETLIDFADSKLDLAAATSIQSHIGGGCTSCDATLDWFRGFSTAASTDLVEPPVWLTRKAVALFAQRQKEGIVAKVSRLVASLVFDSLRSPVPRGARSAAAHARQMLFRALDYDIDVRVAPAGSGLVRISGQVLPGPDRPLDAAAGLEVALLGPEAPPALASTNELGEFDLGPHEEGEYTLCVEAAEERLLVDGLPARRA